MKKKTFLILVAIVLAITALIMGIWLYRRSTPRADVSEYNIYATTNAFVSGLVGKQDILILHSISRNSSGNSVAEFYIYRLPESANALDYMDKTTDQIGNSLEQVGTASCTFIDDNPAAVHDLKALYTK